MVSASLSEPAIDVHYALAMGPWRLAALILPRLSGYFTQICCFFSRQHFSACSIHLSILPGDIGQSCRAQESQEKVSILLTSSLASRPLHLFFPAAYGVSNFVRSFLEVSGKSGSRLQKIKNKYLNAKSS